VIDMSRSFHPLSGLAAATLLCFATSTLAQGLNLGPGDAIAQAEAAIRAEVTKQATVTKVVKEGLEAYRQQIKLKDQALKLSENLRQSDLMCQTMATQDTVATGQQQAAAKVAAAQRRTMRSATSAPSALAAVDTNSRLSNEKFCSEREAAAGICKPSGDTRYVNLAGADQNAMFLFQSREGGDSYAGGRDGSQVEAVEAYINRTVGGVPAERPRGAAANQNLPQARAYTELERRYLAFLSMASYSLNKIKESRNPLK
jgi:hypothetical protein